MDVAEVDGTVTSPDGADADADAAWESGGREGAETRGWTWRWWTSLRLTVAALFGFPPFFVMVGCFGYRDS